MPISKERLIFSYCVRDHKPDCPALDNSFHVSYDCSCGAELNYLMRRRTDLILEVEAIEARMAQISDAANKQTD